MKRRDLRGMPRFGFVGEEGERTEAMVRGIGGESGKEVSEAEFPKSGRKRRSRNLNAEFWEKATWKEM